jgi:hypothetical protein
MKLSQLRNLNFIIVILGFLFMVAKVNGLVCGWSCCSAEHSTQLTSISVNSCCTPSSSETDQVHFEKHCHCIHHILDNFVLEPLEVVAILSSAWMVNSQSFDLVISHLDFGIQLEVACDPWQEKRWRVPISGAEIRIFIGSFLN